MKRWKRIAAVLLVAVMGTALAACGDSDGKTKIKGIKDSEGTEYEGSAGRYVEEDVTLPEGELYALRGLTDGKLRLVCEEGIYDSEDKGETWNLWKGQPQEFTEDLKRVPVPEEGATAFIGTSIYGTALGKSGELFYYVKENDNNICKYMDKDGNISQVNLPDSEETTGEQSWGIGLNIIGFTDAGDLLYADSSGDLVLMDCKANAVKHTFETGKQTGSTGAVTAGEQLYVVNDTSVNEWESDISDEETSYRNHIEVKVYDLTTYEEQEADKGLVDFLNEEMSGQDGVVFDPVFMEGMDGKSVYIINASGIFRYTTGGSVVEKVFNGSMGQMNSDMIAEGAVLDQDNLFLTYYNNTGVSLVRYIYHADIPSVPENEISVYSLYDNQEIRSAITKFQKNNPDVYVVYDTGMSGEDGVEASDAIKTLNTNIMAGEGPDVLMLEGMPVESYQEKGLLMDVSDVIQEVSESEGLFDNIVNAYEQDGRVMVVPTRFSVPVIMGKKESLDQVTDFESFLKMTEEQHNHGGASIIANMDSYNLMKIFLTTSSPSWIQGDGSLDEEKLRAFLAGLQKLADLNQISEENRRGIEMEEGMDFELAQFMTTGEYYLQYLLNENTDLSVFQMKNNWNLFQITSIIKQLGAAEYGYAPAPGQTPNTFLPINSVGISAKSENTDTAKRFLKSLISADSGMSQGWSVNKKAFAGGMEKSSSTEEGVVEITNEDGYSWEYNRIWPAKEDFDRFAEMTEILETPSVTDEIVNKTVLEEGGECLKGNQTVDAAVENIMSKLNLYLSE